MVVVPFLRVCGTPSRWTMRRHLMKSVSVLNAGLPATYLPSPVPAALASWCVFTTYRISAPVTLTVIHSSGFLVL